MEDVFVTKIVVHNDKITPYSSKDLIKFMVQYDYMGLSAARKGDKITERQVSNWFYYFENSLRIVYECPQLKLEGEARLFLCYASFSIVFRIEKSDCKALIYNFIFMAK
jgi:hypothetical protein